MPVTNIRYGIFININHTPGGPDTDMCESEILRCDEVLMKSQPKSENAIAENHKSS